MYKVISFQTLRQLNDFLNTGNSGSPLDMSKIVSIYACNDQHVLVYKL